MGFTADRALSGFLLLVADATILAGCGSVDVTQSGAASGGATIALSSDSYSASPGSSAVLTIYRAGSSVGAATVAYATVDGTAAAGTDYVATTGSVTWQNGDMSAKTVAVPVTAHALGKSFSFALTAVSGNADFGSPAAATVDVRTGGPTSVTLSWTAPTTNTDGSALTNLSGFDIYYGRSADDLTQKISLGTVGQLSYVIENLSAGTWYFEVIAINSSGVESGPSTTASTVI